MTMGWHPTGDARRMLAAALLCGMTLVVLGAT
jgi:hypothetical protein